MLDLESRLTRFVRELEDKASADALRGAIGPSATRRVIVRDLKELLIEWREQQPRAA